MRRRLSSVLRLVARQVSVLLAVTLLLAFPMQSLLGEKLFATEVNSWVDGDFPQLEVGELTDLRAPSNCSPSALVYQSFTKPNGSFSSIPRDITIDTCETSNSLGYYATPGSEITNAYSFSFFRPGTFYGYRILDINGQSPGIIPIRGQGGFLYTQSDGGLNGARTLRLYDDFRSAGKFEPYYASVNEMVFKFGSLIQPLKDNAGSSLYMMDAYAFSPNGEWMLAEIANTGIVRIHTPTRQMQLIDSEYKPQYGMGFRPFTTLAITNDGNTAIMGGHSSFTKVFDLSDCVPTPFVIGSSSNATTGCRSRNVHDNLDTQLSGYTGLMHMRFSNDGKYLTAQAKQYNYSTAKYQYYNITYSIAGYQPVVGGYMALGDSFSSGEGAYNYEPGTDETNPRNKCHLSTRSYPYLVASALDIDRFHNVACSGAIKDTYYQRIQEPESPPVAWLPGAQTQRTYLTSAGDSSVVTISMIGNDIGFSNKLMRCLLVPDSCFHFREDRESVAYEIHSKFNDLVGLYRDIRSDSGGAKVYVLGYPQLINSDTTAECGVNVFLDDGEREFSRGLVSYLNAVIKAAAEKTGVQYIDVEDAFEGRQLCNPGLKAVNGITLGEDNPSVLKGPIGNESFHPTALGHELMAQALLAQSENLNKEMPTAQPSKTAPYVGSATYLALLGTAPSGGTFKRITYTSLQGLDMIFKGIAFTPNPLEQFLMPSSTFEVWLKSTPVQIGTLETNEQGILVGEAVVPEAVEPGFHTLHIYGQNVAGEPIDIYKTIYVAASETDFDGDGVPNDQNPCLIFEPSGEDVDEDGIDDACDGEIGNPPGDSGSNSKPPENNPETNAGNEPPVERGTENSPTTTSSTIQRIASAITSQGGNSGELAENTGFASVLAESNRSQPAQTSKLTEPATNNEPTGNPYVKPILILAFLSALGLTLPKLLPKPIKP